VRHPALEAADWVSPTVLQICDVTIKVFDNTSIPFMGDLFVEEITHGTQSIQYWVDDHGGGTVIFHAYEDLSGAYHFLCFFEFPDEDGAFHFKVRWL
jgi:hypothetical protein